VSESESEKSTTPETAASDDADESLDPGKAKAPGAGVDPTVATPAGGGPGGTAHTPPSDDA
jgi:hypothetical protein